MSDAPARKFVKPAHAGGCIPDPEHPGMDLPQAGADVPWNHYWIARLAREEIVEAEAEPGTAEPEPGTPDPETPADA